MISKLDPAWQASSRAPSGLRSACRCKATTSVSQAAEKLLGMRADEMIGRNCRVFRRRIAGSTQTSLRLELVVAKQAQVGEAIALGFEDRAAIAATLGDVMGTSSITQRCLRGI